MLLPCCHPMLLPRCHPMLLPSLVTDPIPGQVSGASGARETLSHPAALTDGAGATGLMRTSCRSDGSGPSSNWEGAGNLRSCEMHAVESPSGQDNGVMIPRRETNSTQEQPNELNRQLPKSHKCGYPNGYRTLVHPSLKRLSLNLAGIGNSCKTCTSDNLTEGNAQILRHRSAQRALAQLLCIPQQGILYTAWYPI